MISMIELIKSTSSCFQHIHNDSFKHTTARKKIEKLDTWDTWTWGENHLIPGPPAALPRPPLAWRTPMSREIERDDIGGCQLLPGEAPLSPQTTHDGTSTDLWCTSSRLFTYGYPYTYYIRMYIILYIYIYMVPSSVSPPPPLPPNGLGPQVAPPSLLFASYWQHF